MIFVDYIIHQLIPSPIIPSCPIKLRGPQYEVTVSPGGKSEVEWQPSCGEQTKVQPQAHPTMHGVTPPNQIQSWAKRTNLYSHTKGKCQFLVTQQIGQKGCCFFPGWWNRNFCTMFIHWTVIFLLEFPQLGLEFGSMQRQ
jgi:hypothetical protein